MTTAADFDTDIEEDERGFPWAKIAIGVLPLVLVIWLLTSQSEFLFGDTEPESGIEHYPAVAVVLVDGQTRRRAVPLEGVVAAERVAMLRAKLPSLVEEILVRPGQTVAEGDPLCRLLAGETVELLASPIDGRVASVTGVRGTELEAGAVCVSVTDPTSLVATAKLSPLHASVVEAGDDAELAIGGRKMRGGVRTVYDLPDSGSNEPRLVEIELPDGHGSAGGEAAEIRLRTKQIIAVHVPFAALTLHPEHGMAVRVVQGDGRLGVLESLPVTLVAATEDGFYVEGLPATARLVVSDPDFDPPADGETVRIGKVV